MEPEDRTLLERYKTAIRQNPLVGPETLVEMFEDLWEIASSNATVATIEALTEARAFSSAGSEIAVQLSRLALARARKTLERVRGGG